MQEPLARNCRGDTDAVGRFAIGGNCASVFEAGESCEGVLKNLVRRLGRELSYEANAAGIEVEARVDQAGFKVRRRGNGKAEWGGALLRAVGRRR